MNADIEDPLAYHLVLNSSKLGINETATTIIEAVNKFSATHEYIPGVKDRRKIPRRSIEERRKAQRRYDEDLWTTRDTQRAAIKGRSTRTFTKPERRKARRRTSERREISESTE